MRLGGSRSRATVPTPDIVAGIFRGRGALKIFDPTGVGAIELGHNSCIQALRAWEDSSYRGVCSARAL